MVTDDGISYADARLQIILDSAASFGLPATNQPEEIPTTEEYCDPQRSLLLFSANHAAALTKTIENYEDYLAQHPDSLEDLSYTLAQRREHLKIRSFCITDGSVPFKSFPQTKSQGPVQAAFIFTGQGAQWPRMGRELMADYPHFLASIRAMDIALQGLEHRPSWSLESIVTSTIEEK